LDACCAIPEMVNGLLRDGLDPLRCVFEIVNDCGQRLMEVPFAERLTRDVVKPQPVATTIDADAETTLDVLFRSVAHNLAESRDLRRSLQVVRLRLAHTVNAKNKPFLNSIAQVYDLLDSDRNNWKLRSEAEYRTANDFQLYKDQGLANLFLAASDVRVKYPTAQNPHFLPGQHL
ncbi:hypothetical protein I3A86_24705, partial [Salmonella enterica]|nr:hypothetical protein [Salmonella enterica]